MAYVPRDAEWFLADVVLEIRVAGSRRNVVHVNTVIIHASSPEEAYQRAIALGRRRAISYQNPRGQKVTTRFRGLANLDVIHDPLGDECEIMYLEKLGVSEKGIRRLIRSKRKLEVFMPVPVRGRRGRPDYSSGEVMRDVVKLLRSQEMPPDTPLQPPSGARRLRRSEKGSRAARG
jgi:hypothetical protein